MRAQFLNVRPTKTRTVVTALATLLAVGVFLAYTLQTRKARASQGQPTITSFTCVDNQNGSWTASGTVSDSDGHSGSYVELTEAIAEILEVESDGSFSWTGSAQLSMGDWVDAVATDRDGQESPIKTWWY